MDTDLDLADARHARALGGIGEWLRHHAQNRASHIALVHDGLRMDYATLNSRTNHAAQILQRLGVGHGDRVALLLYNGNTFIEMLFACAKLGAIAVPVNFRLSTGELDFILGDSGARVIVHHASLAGALPETGTPEAGPQRITVRGAGTADADSTDYETLLEQASDLEPDVDVAPDMPLIMMYTSGTTGRPKGALLSHANITWNIINSMLGPLVVTREDVALTVAPLFHIGGLNIHSLPALYAGATTILEAHFDAAGTLRTIAAERVTTLFLVPAMWHALTQVGNFDDYDLSSLRTLVSGGAPCPIPVIEFFQHRGMRFLEGFGMTEASPGVCILDNTDAVRKNGSVGKPKMNVRMRIVDEHDNDVPRGETGELIVQGPNVFLGYWGRAKATEEAFRSGWFHTGDLARQDEEGFYYIVDRKKDMLISGGENVYPTEVEQVLYRHPKISEVAVIGTADERWGEVPMALVVPADGEHLTLEELQAFCHDKLARFKTPKHLALLEALPRTATGKVLKRSLRDRYSPG